MNLSDFTAECDAEHPGRDWPRKWHPLMKALALDRAGDWDAAHTIAQEDRSNCGSAVHAYLHRKEGVQWNAEYWYRRCARPPYSGTLEEEWLSLATELLGSL